MNYARRTNQGFTLIELIVAIAILAIMASFAGIVFKVSVEAYRIAGANTEIMQKLRAITDQLNTDFKGLRKDGEIFLVWTAWRADPAFDADDPDGYVRSDRIMFFANGDFATYHQSQGDIRSNLARISYMLANRAAGKPPQQEREKRILSRTQHIITADSAAPPRPNLAVASEPLLAEWRNFRESEQISLAEWSNMDWDPNKKIALSVIADVDVDKSGFGGGAEVEPADPRSIHLLLCEGVGEFEIQGWYEAEQRWVPEVDRDRNGEATVEDTDFFRFLPSGDLDVVNAPGVLYPYPPYGATNLRDVRYDPNFLTEEHFNEIPGLGRALKFTFRLYDSKGILEGGRTFTHIVYLDD